MKRNMPKYSEVPRLQNRSLDLAAVDVCLYALITSWKRNPREISHSQALTVAGKWWLKSLQLSGSVLVPSVEICWPRKLYFRLAEMAFLYLDLQLCLPMSVQNCSGPNKVSVFLDFSYCLPHLCSPWQVHSCSLMALSLLEILSCNEPEAEVNKAERPRHCRPSLVFCLNCKFYILILEI